MSAEKECAFDWIEKNRKPTTEMSDKVWEFAELGLVEFKSSALLADELAKHDFRVERGIAGMPTAFVATWGEGKPVIGIMGEYDALPGLSQKKVPSIAWLLHDGQVIIDSPVEVVASARAHHT